MKIVKKSEATVFENSKTCTVYEYDIHDKNINGAVAELNGRYPESGWVVNEMCKEMVYVIKGNGKIVFEDKEVMFNDGDVFIINPKEKYYWDAVATIFMPCTPAWYPEQHKHIGDEPGKAV